MKEVKPRKGKKKEQPDFAEAEAEAEDDGARDPLPTTKPERPPTHYTPPDTTNFNFKS